MHTKTCVFEIKWYRYSVRVHKFALLTFTAQEVLLGTLFGAAVALSFKGCKNVYLQPPQLFG